MKLGRHVSLFPQIVTDIGKILDSIILRARYVYKFSIFCHQNEKVLDSIILRALKEVK